MAKQDTLTGWLARDEYKNSRKETPGTLCFYDEKPVRDSSSSLGGYWDGTMGDCIELPETMFPELTWKDEPVYVKLTIEVIE